MAEPDAIADARPGRSDPGPQAGAGGARRPAPGHAHAPVQRLRLPRLPLQGGPTAEARAVLPPELHPPREGGHAAHPERGPRGHPGRGGELRPAPAPRRSLDRPRDRTLRPHPGATRRDSGPCQAPMIMPENVALSSKEKVEMNDRKSDTTSTCRLGVRVTPRRPGFDFEGLEHELPRAWHPAGIGPTAFLEALSAMAPVVEGFFIDEDTRLLPRIAA